MCQRRVLSLKLFGPQISPLDSISIFKILLFEHFIFFLHDFIIFFEIMILFNIGLNFWNSSQQFSIVIIFLLNFWPHFGIIIIQLKDFFFKFKCLGLKLFIHFFNQLPYFHVLIFIRSPLQLTYKLVNLWLCVHVNAFILLEFSCGSHELFG